jgi:hypothetical protein
VTAPWVASAEPSVGGAVVKVVASDQEWSLTRKTAPPESLAAPVLPPAVRRRRACLTGAMRPATWKRK